MIAIAKSRTKTIKNLTGIQPFTHPHSMFLSRCSKGSRVFNFNALSCITSVTSAPTCFEYP
uniref:Uncharacterized protein n=1 Tax=Klebsiella pneumoniae TaxID=573 RepID=A0A8B0STF4_KLEPN|nr:hypothetical protein [Klebsiella pneumoniae]